MKNYSLDLHLGITLFKKYLLWLEFQELNVNLPFQDSSNSGDS